MVRLVVHSLEENSRKTIKKKGGNRGGLLDEICNAFAIPPLTEILNEQERNQREKKKKRRQNHAQQFQMQDEF